MASTNILLILTDQQRPDTIGAYRDRGEAGPTTPNLDRLAAIGSLFENAYCSQPVCSPARASILTGLYPHNHGVIDNRTRLPNAHLTLAEYLKPAGFRTGYIGKWHLGRELDAQRGFDAWESTEDYGHGYDDAVDGGLSSSYHRWLVQRGVIDPADQPISRAAAARLPEEHSKPAFIAAAAQGFIAANGNRPFLLTCSFLEPHPPNFGPLDELYDPRDISLPEAWDVDLDPSAPRRFRDRLVGAPPGAWSLSYKGGIVDDPLPGEDPLRWKQTIARYWGLCTLVDRHIGRILDVLDEHHLRESTLVAFTSDHGDMMGAHGFLGKNLPYEGAARVPLIVAMPGFTPRRVMSPVSQVDLVPTLLELLGQPPPVRIDGSSLAAMVRDGDPGRETTVVVEWTGIEGFHRPLEASSATSGIATGDASALKVDWRSLRRGAWKLIVHESGENELYELTVDPWEARNLYADQDHEEVVEQLWAALQEWQAKTRDPLALPGR